jgi:DNA-binding MarR family transcriptional regulator
VEEPVAAEQLRGDIQELVIRFIADVILFNHAVAHELGLGSSDGQFLTLLQVHGHLTPGQLADITGLTTGTVTGVIDRLENAGFVHRVRDTADRRKILVQRDERAIAQRAAPAYQQQGARLQAVLRKRSTAELRVIADFLRDLIA